MTLTSTKPLIDWLPNVHLLPEEFAPETRTYLKMAYGYAAANSKDPSTQLGAVLIDSDWRYLALSCNKFPNGVAESPERWERPKKYFYVEHAERGAIYKAAKNGLRTQGQILICPWFACADCARGMIEAGIKMAVGHKTMFDGTPERWRESITEAFAMLHDAKVQCYVYDGLLNADKIRFNGELIQP